MDQRNVSIQDIMYLVESGQVKGSPEWNADYNEYHYCITGEDIEGIELTLKIAISIKDEQLTFITVF